MLSSLVDGQRAEAIGLDEATPYWSAHDRAG